MSVCFKNVEVTGFMGQLKKYGTLRDTFGEYGTFWTTGKTAQALWLAYSKDWTKTLWYGHTVTPTMPLYGTILLRT